MGWRGVLTVMAAGMLSHAVTPAARAADPLTDALPVAGVQASAEDPVPSVPLTPAAVLDAAGRADAPDTILAAQRALLERAWGTRLADWRTAAAAQADGEESTARIPIGSSDLDGDGHGDAVFFEVGYDEFGMPIRVGVTALDGRTGDPLWSRDYGNPYDLLVLSPGDVSGDGAADLVVVAVTRTITRTALPSAGNAVRPYRDEAAWGWDIALVDGPGGTDRWTRRIDGNVAYTGSTVGGPPAGVEAAEIEATNGLFDLRRSGDDDGDGHPDVLLTRYDFSSALLFGQLVHGAQTLLTAHAESVDAATGGELYARDSDAGPGGATLRSTGDVTGDGRDDLLWAVPTELSTPTACLAQSCASARRTALDVELVDGASRAAAWTYELRDPDVVAAAPVLAGHGRVVLAATRADATTQLYALAGAGGEELWRVDTALSDVPLAVGDDLMLWEGTEPEGVDFRLRLRRIDGATGADVLTTQHDLPAADETLDILIATPVGDVDGDDAPDVMVAEWHFTPPWEPDGTARTLLSVESGADGSPLYAGERDRKALLFAGGDLLPDGNQDLFEGSTAYDDRGFLRLSAIAMPSGRQMWTRDDVVTTARFGTARADSGDDVIYGRVRLTDEPGHVISRIDALRGASGVRMWGHGDPFGDPDPLPEVTPTPSPDPTPTPSPDPLPAPEVGVPAPLTADATSPPAVAPVPGPPSARARVLRARLAGRRLRVRLACAGRCSGRVVARVRLGRRVRVVRSARFSIGPGTATVTLRLPPSRHPARARVLLVRVR